MSNLLHVDRTACTGCGTCVDHCPTGAISLDEDAGVSTIDQTLCDECMDCLEVCPNGAIQKAEFAELVPAGEEKVSTDQAIQGHVVTVPESSPVVAIREPGRLTFIAGAALTFIGNHLLPRAADALIEAMERRLTRGARSELPDGSIRSGGRSLKGKGGGGRGGGHGGGRGSGRSIGRGGGRRRRQRRFM